MQAVRKRFSKLRRNSASKSRSQSQHNRSSSLDSINPAAVAIERECNCFLDKHAVIARFAEYSQSDACALKEKCQPRVTFVSLLHLKRQWCQMPLDVLYHSICIFAADRNVVMNASVIDGSNSQQMECFRTVLLLKESQNLLLWVDPHRNSDGNKIDYRFAQISQFLEKIADPICRTTYRPLILDRQWWQRKIQKDSGENAYQSWSDVFKQLEYCCDIAELDSELLNMHFRYKPILEIIHQSNLTLVPMICFDEVKWRIKSLEIVQFQTNILSGIEKPESKSKPQIRYFEILINIDEVKQLRVKPPIPDCDGFVFL